MALRALMQEGGTDGLGTSDKIYFKHNLVLILKLLINVLSLGLHA